MAYHLRNLSDKCYADLCRVIWREANRKFFAGKLLRCPYFRIVPVNPSGAFWQATNAARDRITVNRSAECNATFSLLVSTLVHEMVHQEQAQHSSPYIRREHHGRFFRRRAAEIVNLGLGFDIVSMYPKRKTK